MILIDQNYCKKQKANNIMVEEKKKLLNTFLKIKKLQMQIKKMKKSAEICQEQKIGIRNRFKGNRYKNVKERKS